MGNSSRVKIFKEVNDRSVYFVTVTLSLWLHRINQEEYDILFVVKEINAYSLIIFRLGDR